MNRHYGSYQDKLETLKSIDGPKTVFVGGSSVLCGINAEHYSEISGQCAVNMGLQALKSPDIYLSCILPYINSGDTVFIAFEYDVYNSADKWESYDSVGLDVAHLSNEYYKDVPLRNIPEYFFQQFSRSYERMGIRLYGATFESLLPKEKTIYLRENINSFGDLRSDLAIESQQPAAIDVCFDVDTSAIEILRSYILDLQKKGADVFILFAPLYCNAGSSAADQFYSTIHKEFGDMVLGSSSDWIFDSGERFFDTGYHLIREESIKHTEYIFSLLQQHYSDGTE